jgi:hypothetical protein
MHCNERVPRLWQGASDAISLSVERFAVQIVRRTPYVYEFKVGNQTRYWAADIGNRSL